MKRIATFCALFALVGCAGGDGPAFKPSGPFDYDREASLAFEDAGRLNQDYPIEIRDVSYASPKEGKGRVTAYLVRPPGDGPYAGMILQHGAEANRQQLVIQAAWLAGRGVVALVVDSPNARGDVELPRGTAGLRVERDQVVQNVVELRRAVDVLLAQKNVDGKRIGFLGYSAGARAGAILAGVENRIAAYDLISGGSAPVAEYVRLAPPEARRDVRTLLGEIDPLRHVRAAAPAKLFFQNGRQDRVVPRAALVALYRAASRPKEIRWYEGGHEPSFEVYRDAITWLTQRLGLSTRPVVPGVRIGP
jgi:dienelactone hydrolase